MAGTLLFLAASVVAQAPIGAVPTTVPIDQSTGINASTNGNYFDNTRANLVRHQLGHVEPIAIDPFLGAYLFAPNNAGQRLSITYLPSNTLVMEIPTGPGITTVRSRPNTGEAWAVDSINGCISVIDPISLRIVRTIQVGKEPHGLVFLGDGSRAYVTCSATNSVDVIDCASYSVVKSIRLESGTSGASTPSAITPRGITIAGNRVWVAPFYSGNGTCADRNPDPAFAGTASIVTPAPSLRLPDEDLFAIQVTGSPATDALDLASTVTGLGTILFNVHAHPEKDELWIPNTEALNTIVGEANFLDGKVVSNRISIVSPGGGSTTILDLDAMCAAANVGPAAQPVAVAFDLEQDRAYVAAFGSDAVLVLDTSAGHPSGYTVIGRHLLTPRTPPMPAGGSTPVPVPARCGPRGLALMPGSQELVVFNGIDNSYSRIDLTIPSSTAPTAFTLGFDPTPAAVKRGLGHLANADHSGDGSSSCMSCHVDGHFDMLVWDLSAFHDQPGTVSPQFEVDDKGPMATQSLRGLFAAGPLHWRGERAKLSDFNVGGFVALLKRPNPLTTEEFAELAAGTDSLVYPSNPRQPASRNYSAAATTGLVQFRTTPAVSGRTCAECHQLPLGSNAELQALAPQTRSAAVSGKVAQLRGVGDKLGPVHQAFPLALTTFGERTINGWGLSHNGSIGSLQRFIAEFPGVNGSLVNPLNPSGPRHPNFIAEIAAFCEQFDTGLAPSTAWQESLPAGTSVAAWNSLLATTIIPQRQAGHCDFVIAGSVLVGSQFVVFSMTWDHQQNLWQTGLNGVAFTDAQVHQFTMAAGLPITVFGMPLGTGWRFGVDRDLDGLFNDSESTFAPFVPSDVWNPDSDGDGFPDGHEVVHGRNPRANQGNGTPDTQPPTVVGSPVVVFKTASTAKIELTTNEPARVEVINAVGTTSPADGRFDVNHTIFVRELVEGATTTLSLRLTDAVGNHNVSMPVTVSVGTLAVGNGARVEAMKIVAVTPTTVTVRVNIGTFQVPMSNMANYDVELFAYANAPGGPLIPVATSMVNTVSSGGSVDFQLPIPIGMGGTPGARELHFGVRDLAPPPGNMPPYLEGKDVLSFRTQSF